jgi:hypothetical protein
VETIVVSRRISAQAKEDAVAATAADDALHSVGSWIELRQRD